MVVRSETILYDYFLWTKILFGGYKYINLAGASVQSGFALLAPVEP